MFACLSVLSHFRQFRTYGLTFFRRARESMVMVRTLKHIRNSLGGGVFLTLLRDLRQTSTERFVKQAVVRDMLWREDVITIDIALQHT